MGRMKTFSFAILETISSSPGLTRVDIFEDCKTVFPKGPIGWSTFKWTLTSLIANKLVDILEKDDRAKSTFFLSSEGRELLE